MARFSSQANRLPDLNRGKTFGNSIRRKGVEDPLSFDYILPSNRAVPPSYSSPPSSNPSQAAAQAGKAALENTLQKTLLAIAGGSLAAQGIGAINNQINPWFDIDTSLLGTIGALGGAYLANRPRIAKPIEEYSPF